MIRFLCFRVPRDKVSALCVRCIRCAIVVVLLGGLSNGVVMLANGGKMPVITGAERVSELVPQETECLYAGKNAYAHYAYPASFAKEYVEVWFLGDWVRIEQPIDLSALPRPLRFIARGVVCIPEGVVYASPGDVTMWTGVLVFIMSIFVLAARRAVLRLCSARLH